MGEKWWEKDSIANAPSDNWWEKDSTPGASDTVSDVGHGALSKLSQGTAALLGTPRAILDTAGNATDWALGKLGASPEFRSSVQSGMHGFYESNPITSAVSSLPSPNDISKGVSGLTGGYTDYEPHTQLGKTVGEIAYLAPSAAAAALTGGATLPESLVYGAVVPGATGSVAQPAGEYAARQIGLENPEAYGEAAKLATEFIAPMAASRMFGRIGATPLPEAQDRAAEIAKLEKFGIPVTSGSYHPAGPQRQAAISGELSNPNLSAVLGGQDEAFTRGIMQELGISDQTAHSMGYAGGLTRDNIADVLQKGSDQVGQYIGSLYDRAVPPSSANQIGGVINAARNQFGLQAPAYQASFGSQLHNIRRDLNDIITGAVDNPAFRTQSAVDNARYFKSQLDDLIEKSIGSNAYNDLQMANDQFSRMSIVKDALGSAKSSGVLSPEDMVKAIGKSTGKPADLEQISKIAQKYLISNGLQPTSSNMRKAIRWAVDTAGSALGYLGMAGASGMFGPKAMLATLSAGAATDAAQRALLAAKNSIPATNLAQRLSLSRAVYGDVPSAVRLPAIVGEMDAGSRQGRKSGGRVGDHEAAADQLVLAAERAKKGLSKQTEPLLNQSDDAVAHALEVANRSI